MRRSDNRFWSVFACGAACALGVVLLWQSLYQPPVAQAQIPDSGRQRNEMVEELKLANKKLAEIAGLLTEMRDLDRKQAAADKSKSE